MKFKENRFPKSARDASSIDSKGKNRNKSPGPGEYAYISLFDKALRPKISWKDVQISKKNYHNLSSNINSKDISSLNNS